MTNEVKNVPELRFPGFEDEWKEKKLGTIFTVTMGQSPNSTNYTDNPNDTILVQGNADIYKGKIWPRIYTKEITKLLERNDIILSVRAPVGEIGIAQVEACIGRGVCSIKGNKFLYYFLDLFKKQNRWSRFSQGSTFESISGKDIRDLKFYVCNSEEQNKIGEFFNKLDRQIELGEQKLEKLEEQKKGYMQQIFSQQLRFKDENGDYYSEWKEKLIKDILEFENNRRKPITSSLREIGKYPYYGATGIIDYVKDYIFDGETRLLIGEDGAKWGAFEESSFIAKNRYWVNNHAHVCKSKINNLVFLNYLLNYKELRTYVTGNAPAKLTYNNLSMIPMFLPSVYEQEKIGNFLKKIDELIGKQNKKINELKIRKQGFLQKMFI